MDHPGVHGEGRRDAGTGSGPGPERVPGGASDRPGSGGVLPPPFGLPHGGPGKRRTRRSGLGHGRLRPCSSSRPGGAPPPTLPGGKGASGGGPGGRPRAGQRIPGNRAHRGAVEHHVRPARTPLGGPLLPRLGLVRPGGGRRSRRMVSGGQPPPSGPGVVSFRSQSAHGYRSLRHRSPSATGKPCPAGGTAHEGTGPADRT